MNNGSGRQTMVCHPRLLMRARHEQLRDERRPPRLMRRTDASSGVAVKVFVERNVVAVMGIQLQLRLVAQHRPFSHVVLQEDARHAVREFGCNLVEV